MKDKKLKPKKKKKRPIKSNAIPCWNDPTFLAAYEKTTIYGDNGKKGVYEGSMEPK